MEKGGHVLFSCYTGPPPTIEEHRESDDGVEWFENNGEVKRGEVEEVLESGTDATWEIKQAAYSNRDNGRRTWDVAVQLTTSTLHKKRELKGKNADGRMEGTLGIKISN